MENTNLNENIYYCEKCGNPHNGTYGSGRFCSSECSHSFSSNHVSADGRARQVAALNDPNNREKSKQSRKYKPTQINKKHITKEPTQIYKEPERSTPKKSSFKGSLGEYATIKKFTEHDVPVYIPVVDEGVDMVVDINGELKRVQVKSSSFTNEKNRNGDSTIFYTRNDDQRYNKNNIEYFALYDINYDDVYLVNGEQVNTKSISIKHIDPKSTENHANSKYDLVYQIDNVLDNLLYNDIVDIIE